MYIIGHDEIARIVEELKKEYTVFGPQVEKETGQVFFDQTEGIPDLDAPIPSMPPKDIVFPQLERIFKYRYEGKMASIDRQYFEKPKALMGIRACDLTGIQCLDRFFLGQEFVDEVYQTHRKKTFIVANTCITPFKQCFCVCTDSGPYAKEGFDLNLTRLSGGYLVEVGSDKGRALAEKLGLNKAEEKHLNEKHRAINKSIGLFTDRAKDNKAWVSRVMNRITTGFIKQEIWEFIGNQCFECGACSFVCPSCSCFNIEDACLNDGGCERLRTRDSCSFEGYTRMAGDHNPRKPVEDRRNKRFFCKLSYSQSKKYLRPGCVGCGRCAWVCPGDIGLPNVVQYIRRERDRSCW